MPVLIDCSSKFLLSAGDGAEIVAGIIGGGGGTLVRVNIFLTFFLIL